MAVESESTQPDSDAALPIVRPHRSWGRFGIRTLLILTLIACLLGAWFGEYYATVHTERPIANRLRSGGAYVYYWKTEGKEKGQLKGPRWARKILGFDFFSSVSMVKYTSPYAEDADLVGIHRLSDLTDLELNGPGFTDASADDIKQIEQLEWLTLVGTNHTPKGIKQLASPTVKNITLLGYQFNNAHCKEFKAFENLERVECVGGALTDVGMNSISMIPNLRQLTLRTRGHISEQGLQFLGRCSKLESLALSAERIDDNSMAAIGKLTRLKDLHFLSMNVTDDGIKQLQSLSNLERLTLESYGTTGDSLKTISKLTTLKYLEVVGEIEATQIGHLLWLTNLESLNLYNAELSDEGIKQLHAMNWLKQVTLPQMMSVRQVNALKKVLPNCVVE